MTCLKLAWQDLSELNFQVRSIILPLADDIEDIDSVIVHVDPAIEKNEGDRGIK